MGLWELFFGKSEAQKRVEETARVKREYRKGKTGPWYPDRRDPGMPDANRRDLNAIERQHGGDGGRW